MNNTLTRTSHLRKHVLSTRFDVVTEVIENNVAVQPQYPETIRIGSHHEHYRFRFYRSNVNYRIGTKHYRSCGVDHLINHQLLLISHFLVCKRTIAVLTVHCNPINSIYPCIILVFLSFPRYSSNEECSGGGEWWKAVLRFELQTPFVYTTSNIWHNDPPSPSRELLLKHPSFREEPEWSGGGAVSFTWFNHSCVTCVV